MQPITITKSAFVKVAIVEEIPLVRERLKAVLHAHAAYADVVGETAEAQAAIGASGTGVRRW